MMRTTVIVRALTAGVFLALATSCDSAGGRCEISGEITLGGRPLDQGVITFVGTGQEATQASAVIANGKYSIAKAQGLVPGKYRVAISAPDGQTPVDPGAAPGPSGNFSSKDRIPAKYNTESTEEIEVKQGGDNKFNFTIP